MDLTEDVDDRSCGTATYRPTVLYPMSKVAIGEVALENSSNTFLADDQGIAEDEK